MSAKGNPGMNKLALTLLRQMKETGDKPLMLDYGVIQSDNSLLTDTYPVPIPQSDYMVCGSLVHNVGDRVLVAWVQNDAVVIDTITPANVETFNKRKIYDMTVEEHEAATIDPNAYYIVG